jgi:hypothetical protein
VRVYFVIFGAEVFHALYFFGQNFTRIRLRFVLSFLGQMLITI